MFKKIRRLSSLPAHPYHLVDVSPWPILKSFGLQAGAQVLVSWLSQGVNNKGVYILTILNIVVISCQWLRDIIREGMSGAHSSEVTGGIKKGFKIFQITEVLLFISFFWAFFHASLNPSIEQVFWPPLGINSIDFLSLPLLNSILLLSSGFILTWAHHVFISLPNNNNSVSNKYNTLAGKIITISLIIIFVGVQYVEYSYSEFSISDSVFGSTFFSLTGLHSLHVMAAIILLSVASYRIAQDNITSEHSIGLDVSIFYFHFTDVIWLFLYAVLYFWGG